MSILSTSLFLTSSPRYLRQCLGCCLGIALLVSSGVAQTNPRPITVAVLDLADTSIGKLAAARFAAALASLPALSIVDRDLSRAAARGARYQGSLNMSLPEARDLGAAIGCDFYVIGDAQTLRRSPSVGPAYFESYAVIFLVSARTGKLISWERPNFEVSTAAAAERLLLEQLARDETRSRYLLAIQKAKEDERHEREIAIERNTPVIEEITGDAANEGQSLRPPRPYRRLRPVYPEAAARADAEATVDVLVDLDQQGEVTRVAVARWAGFGLDEATMNTVRQMHFFPATRDRVAIPSRVLLRYNFRKPTEK
jgi:TonB family protein